MTAAVSARREARLPANAAKAPAKAEPSAKAKASQAGEGAQQLQDPPPNRAAKAKQPEDLERARAKPGKGAEEIAPPEPKSGADKKLEAIADKADRVFARLVDQREKIQAAVEFGDKGAAAEAFGRARALFAKLVALGNEAQINMSSSTESEAAKEAKARIAGRVTDGYTWAALIEEAMPGDQTV